MRSSYLHGISMELEQEWRIMTFCPIWNIKNQIFFVSMNIKWIKNHIFKVHINSGVIILIGTFPNIH
jgi:hypothetical protein